MATPQPPSRLVPSGRRFRETHPLATLLIVSGLTGVAGYFLGSNSSCSGNRNLLTCQEQLAAAQSYQERFRSKIGDTLAKYFGSNRVVPIVNANGSINENATLTEYSGLVDLLVQDANAAKSKSADAGSPTAPVVCARPSQDLSDCISERDKYKRQLDSATSAETPQDCLAEQTTSYDQGFTVGKDSVKCPTADCSSEYQRGLKEGKAPAKISDSKMSPERACTYLKNAHTESALKGVLSRYVAANKRPIQVSVNDPALSLPEAAQGVIREFCGADAAADKKFVTEVDTLLTGIYGREAMYPSKVVIGQQRCSAIEGRVVRIGTEY